MLININDIEILCVSNIEMIMKYNIEMCNILFYSMIYNDIQ